MIVAYETFDCFVAPFGISSIKRVKYIFISLLAFMKLYELKIQNWENIHLFPTLCCYQFATSLSPFLFAHCFHLRLFCATDHRSPRHFHGFLSGINGGVFLQPCVSSCFPCYLHVDITPSGIKKHHFQRVTDLRKKNIGFFKKNTNERTKTAEGFG